MMVESLYAAVHALLSAFGLPVYAQYRVPDGAVYPYLVWSGTVGPMGSETALHVKCWYRADYDGCIRTLDALFAMIPEQGLLLPFEGGRALIWCREVYIQTDAKDSSVTGGCMQLGMRCYPGASQEEAMV